MSSPVPLNDQETDAGSAWDYRQRARPFGAEIGFRLDHNGLTIDNGRKIALWPYHEIAEIRLTYEPKSVVWHAFRIKLVDRKGRSVSMTNLNWTSYVQANRQDAEYTRFVSDLIDRIRKANPRLVAVAGKPALLYFATLAFASLSGLLLLATAVMAAMAGAWLSAGLAMLFLLPFSRMSLQLIRRNKPEDFSRQAIPARLMPDQPV